MTHTQCSREISDIKHGDVGDAHSDASGAVAVTVTDVGVATVMNALQLEMSRLGTMLTADSPEALMAAKAVLPSLQAVKEVSQLTTAMETTTPVLNGTTQTAMFWQRATGGMMMM